jgi:hypothetical protein
VPPHTSGQRGIRLKEFHKNEREDRFFFLSAAGPCNPELGLRKGCHGRAVVGSDNGKKNSEIDAGTFSILFPLNFLSLQEGTTANEEKHQWGGARAKKKKLMGVFFGFPHQLYRPRAFFLVIVVILFLLRSAALLA